MAHQLLTHFGLDKFIENKGDLKIYSPIDGAILAILKMSSNAETEAAIENARKASLEWKSVPAPKRGEFIRVLGQVLRENKESLGKLVSLECGKIYEEGLGEVQEMIDMCDFAVGLSRQLYGLTIVSERPEHRMMENWHPLGVVGVVSAFNFPVAVWAWNFALAIVCGNAVIWKPSEKTPLCGLACQELVKIAAQRCSFEVPSGLSQVLVGDRSVGQSLVQSPHVALISATGSTRMGREVGVAMAKRFGKSILELGGNNAMIVTPSADLGMTVRAILFSAVGTAGQRCTSLRRVIVHTSLKKNLMERLQKSYASIPIGNPLEKGKLMGPLIDKSAYETMQSTLAAIQKEGGKVFGGQRTLEKEYPNAYYVTPALVEMETQTQTVFSETFAPILYVMAYENLDEALRLHNEVPQGLSSCIFTTDLREAEIFLSARGSDCGIANVNIGPSGAEIGGAFGGEKETGGGRESGSDAWKAYMRRQTNTINYSKNLPLAQGIKFEIGD